MYIFQLYAMAFFPRLSAFQNAWAGLRILLQEFNFRFHIVSFVFVVGAAFLFGVSEQEWRSILIVSGFVFVAEGINTAIEQACDSITEEYRVPIKAAKDVAAAAVLMACICAAAVGWTVFFPRIVSLL